MKFRVIFDEPIYLDFDKFTLQRWPGYGDQMNFSVFITTKDGKEHVTHFWHNKDQLKHLHEITVKIDEHRRREGLALCANKEPVPVDSIMVERD